MYKTNVPLLSVTFCKCIKKLHLLQITFQCAITVSYTENNKTS